MRVPTAGHQVLGLKYINFLSGACLYKLFPVLIYLYMLSFQIKLSQGGAGVACCVLRLHYAERQTVRGVWRRFTRQIAAGLLLVVPLPCSRLASLTDPLLCWLPTLIKDWLGSLRGEGGDKAGKGQKRKYTEKKMMARGTYKGCVTGQWTFNDNRNSFSSFVSVLFINVQLCNFQFFQYSEHC